MTAGWLGFWDGAHSIYVNARHKDVHYRLIAAELAALVPSQRAAAAPRSSARLTPEGSGPVGGGANRGLDDRARGRHLIGSWAHLDSPFDVLAQFLL